MGRELFFSISELCNSDIAIAKHINNAPKTMEQINNMVNLIFYVLQPLREKLGKPVHVESGFRCKELNNLVGGKPNSQHLIGEAADIWVNSCTPQTLYNYIEGCGIEYDQLILEKTKTGSWVHISYRHKHNRKQAFSLS